METSVTAVSNYSIQALSYVEVVVQKLAEQNPF